MRVLYSAIGTTDPVRGLRDGGLMHIMRFYRPDTVYLFLSEEMVRRDRADSRIDKTFAHIRENWDGYDPKVIRFETEIQDPSDMDALLAPMEELLERILAEHAGEEIFINLSSGTPQMQIILAQMAQNPRHRNIRGIQVKSPERQSGTTERTNTRFFPVDEALGLNEDEEPDQPNRCCEPHMIAIRREAVRNQLRSLVSQRNYAAIALMGSDLPAPYPKLARHLNYRSRFLLDEAMQAAVGLSIPGLQLRATLPDPIAQRREYKLLEMVEYFSMLRHLVYLKRYTEFALRLNPFVIKLQIALLDQLVQPLGYREWHLLSGTSRKRVSPSMIAGRDPALLTALSAAFNGTVEERDVSITALNVMLGHYGLPADVLQLMWCCEAVNTTLRNSAAHDFFTVTNDHIVNARVRINNVEQPQTGRTAEQIVRELETLLLQAADSCRNWGLEQRLNVYVNCDRLLRECL